MKFKKLALAGAMAIGLCSAATAAETLRFSSFEPPVAHVTKNILTPWAEDVAAASDGELEIQMFPGGTLGRSPAQQLKLVEDGVADIAWVIPGYTPGRFDQGSVSELPFMIPSSAAGSAAMWSMYEQGLFTGDYDKFKLIGIMVSAPNGLATIAPIREPGDLNGLNLRAPGPTMLSAIDALGAVPVGGITGPTIAESISRGLIDGTFTQWGAIETFRMGEVVKNYLALPLGATPMLIVMNKAKYDGLSDTAKAALDKFSGAAFSERFGKSFDANVAEARERTRAANPIAELVPDEALARQWRDALAVATTDWIANTENGQAIYDALTKSIADVSN
ncbi:TRAP transporter substrate-binding protein [uncultured Hoeflea sp.]|uniref:TRAP transporter substrate-binding protein n=1 Tax=uncultured Hoeflea sp. TaxID=538666 RepID=UPI0030DA649B